ncbi:hypothetical protein GX48_05152 [Paracoccidioides brasiliensis]|nr:hypothetical protein GX48_05152 [Paracoccidioides brasiliensis]
MANHPQIQWEEVGQSFPPQQQPPQPLQQHLHPQLQALDQSTLSRTSINPVQGLEPSTSKGPSTSSIDRPSFTFIDHDDDLASKRIKDVRARRAIRSHVMRDVRRRERLAGLKRTSTRGDKSEHKNESKEIKKRSSSSSSPLPSTSATTTTKNRWKSNVSNDDLEMTQDSALNEERSLDSRSSSAEIFLTSKSPSGVGSSATSITQDGAHSPFPSSPVTQVPVWAFDPFGTLPGSTPTTFTIIDGLIKYFSSVLIPMTFPAETKQPATSKNRMARIITEAISDPGPFFGYMSLCAAHRAILQGKHSHPLPVQPAGKDRILYEPDYYVMKAKCINEMNKKMLDPKLALTDSAFDVVISLTSSALTIGDFDEARIHIQGLKKMVDARGGVRDSSFQGEGARILSNILTCDVTTACGLMTRPFFPLTWDSQPIPPETLERMLPPPSSPLHNTAMLLCTYTGFSPELRKALFSLRKLLFFEYANHLDPNHFTALEHEIFLFKSHETEYELLDYPFRLAQLHAPAQSQLTTTNPNPNQKFSRPHNPHPFDSHTLTSLENLTRITAICHISQSFVVSPPSSGMGRALTHHLINAISKFHPSTFTRLHPSQLDLLAWAAFVGARCAKDQPTKYLFLPILKEIGRVRGWRDWGAVETGLSGFLYMKALHGGIFERIWEEAEEGPVVVEVTEGEWEV